MAAIFVVASCQDVKRDFGPSSGGSGGSNSGATGGRLSTNGSGKGGSGNGAGDASDAGSGGRDEPSAGASNAIGGAGGGNGGDCESDTVRCHGDVPEVCGRDGTWEATHPSCAFGCLNGVCGDCQERATGCETGQTKLCVDGKWQYNPCDAICEQGECVDSCTEGARQCEGLSKVQVCKDGAFIDDEDCSGICRDGACTGDCKPDATRCNPDSKSTPQLCSADAEWTDTECPGTASVCLDGHCVACDPGTVRCGTSGVPQHCTDFGSWEDQPPCSGEAPACVSGECVLCEPESRRCDAGKPQQCSLDGTRWVDGAACGGATPACVAATGKCGTCRAGDVQCASGTSTQTCDASGGWSDESKCSAATPACLDGACVDCHPKDRRCSGTTPELCNDNGKWVAQSACGGSTPRCIDASGTCGCEDKAVDCQDANTPTACSAAGTWVPQTDCSGDTPVCQKGACACVEGTQECTSSSTPRRCTSGSWETGTCDGSTPICVAGRCAECSPDSTRCAADGSHKIERCSTDGVWKDDRTQCAFCAKGRCYDPAGDPDLVGCDAQAGLMCKGLSCCHSTSGRSTCQDLSQQKCAAGVVTIACDGPGDCGSKAPVCCATAAGVGCVATATACTDLPGQIACDPNAATPCANRLASCVRASDTFFTCQAARGL
jgi:hypothetical protein